MAKVTGPLNRTQIKGLAGTLDYYTWKGVHVIRGWPRKQTTPKTARQIAWQNTLAESRKDLKLMDGLIKSTWGRLTYATKRPWLDEYTSRYMKWNKIKGTLPPVITSLCKVETETSWRIYAKWLREPAWRSAVREEMHFTKRGPHEQGGERWRTRKIIPGAIIVIDEPTVPVPIEMEIDEEEDFTTDFRWGMLFADTVEDAVAEYWTTIAGNGWAPFEPPEPLLQQSLYWEDYGGFGLLTYDDWQRISEFKTSLWFETYAFPPDTIQLNYVSQTMDAYRGVFQVQPWGYYKEIISPGSFSFEVPYSAGLGLEEDVTLTRGPTAGPPFAISGAGQYNGMGIAAGGEAEMILKKAGGEKYQEIFKADIAGLETAWVEFLAEEGDPPLPYIAIPLRDIPVCDP